VVSSGAPRSGHKSDPDLERMYWIGGSPCAGKSTVARLLAEAHDLSAVECDRDSAARWTAMAAAGMPVATELTALATCQRLERPPQWQADMEVGFYREQFDVLRRELADLSTTRPLVVEGADLLPELMETLGVPSERSVWLVPTPDFQWRYYRSRTWVRPYLAGCPDPERAFANWMRRDVIFADYVARTARQRGGAVLVVDGSAAVEGIAELVGRHFGLVGPITA
jgi:hypothetical protein